ncbi:1845_t:CDS:2 [Ambispora gerdemannii]|uniref:ubiquitinyl hydrolase 1 n=1 Tax=Ambispora gerdemannii TaxID=144530 RepID=A0A9N8VME7_9GLOM|nr:1845_t:CDS:2 [Ambispora gerdemannii]
MEDSKKQLLQTRQSPIKKSHSPMHRIRKRISSILLAFLFSPSRSSSPIPAKKIYSAEELREKEHKIDQLQTFLADIGHPMESMQVELLLERNSWNVELVAEYCRDMVEAEEGLVNEVNNNVCMVGAENDRGTSCYIDSLLFAMFARMRAFDGLLYVEPEKPDASDLLVHLRLFVNRLRSGSFLNTQMQLRENLRKCGWIGTDDKGHPTQEDTSEFFLFLSSLFELPYLPLGIHLYHGATEEANDERVVTERIIQIAIPGDPQDLAPVSLEEALMLYFHNNVVSGINRTVGNDNRGGDGNDGELMELKESEEEEYEDEKSQTIEEVPVSAWQFLKLLPFYSASNEQGEQIHADTFQFPDKNLILPLVLKRYGYNDKYQPFRIEKRVIIPPSVNFNTFLNLEAVDEPCRCNTEHRYRLQLRSVVCHIGSNLSSGHYIGYTSDDEGWYKLDDLNTEQRVKRYGTIEEITYLFNEFSLNAYLLFYELQFSHPAVTIEEEAIELDHHVAQNLQLKEFSNGGGPNERNCCIQ